MARVLKNHPVIMVTREALKDIVTDMKMTYAATLDEALAMAEAIVGSTYSLNVIPNGISVIMDN